MLILPSPKSQRQLVIDVPVELSENVTPWGAVPEVGVPTNCATGGSVISPFCSTSISYGWVGMSLSATLFAIVFVMPSDDNCKVKVDVEAAFGFGVTVMV